ncbi:hypothetical protein AO385_1671 [Moraxella catarrhalis]|uniref:Uncharacterized protein n=1 Tax=Moraxella catarrhalis TaxID=480 RepID=A0A198UVN0_MORCA|nr:hypothetical protein AO384_1218 [Moraxella catarrhalis]OAU97363.1 hypothetical protein AO383_0923 [Moraxella catarrhalis]OAU97913.1 hypothetical protein AO385_1671 [Moraxella catarrhalis]OAV00599.1 hypothetical protein AO382_1332 [Moraxella catarrhalis]
MWVAFTQIGKAKASAILLKNWYHYQHRHTFKSLDRGKSS